jgi:putative FmdB family regulatory protein
MPVYEHLCSSGHKIDRYLKLAQLDDIQVCECGKEAQRLISTPHFHVDFPAYISPTTGRLISSRTQRREDLIASNCVEYEPSMKEEKDRRVREDELRLEKKIDEHVEKTIYEMPGDKRDRLVAELEHGVDISVTRS